MTKFFETKWRKVFLYKHINEKDRWFDRGTDLRRLTILPFSSVFWIHSRWRNTRIQAPCIETPGPFSSLNVVPTSPPRLAALNIVWNFRTRGQQVLALFKLPHSGAIIYVQSLPKFSTWDVHGRSIIALLHVKYFNHTMLKNLEGVWNVQIILTGAKNLVSRSWRPTR